MKGFNLLLLYFKDFSLKSVSYLRPLKNKTISDLDARLKKLEKSSNKTSKKSRGFPDPR